MSTFGGLNTAMTGLNAARLAMETAGQNIANVGTAGYTRQRADVTSVGAPATVGPLAGRPAAGQGVSIVGIARLADAHLDARVRGTAAAAGFADTRAAGLADLEGILREPGQNGLSSLLSGFWAGWQEVANRPGDPAPAAALIGAAQQLASRLSASSRELDQQWTAQRGTLDSLVSELNSSAGRVAELNGSIRSTVAAGGNANELLDQRATLTARIAELSGATVRDAGDGTVEVLLGGNALVAGTSARTVQVSEQAQGARVPGGGTPALEWRHRPGEALSLDAGRIAGSLSLLAPADGAGTGGPIAELSAALDTVAAALADTVNEVQLAGARPDGRPATAFFGYDAARPAASLAVLAAGAHELATGTPGAGPLDGSNADRMAALADAPGGADALWSATVLAIGTATRAEAQQSVLAAVASVAAATQQQSAAGVSLDEENVALIAHQHAYQGAARVMTAIDEMLDTLINRTGVVGR
ncbi:flagellar hook-associated protein FlgK [Arthrobacter halodurans]|uniref:Flagellar hook-associated protein 1 n=1 Tax=Arthrobacter halodurans TaxID=516699 RepID=A0ABV4UNW4_9MICC